MQPESILKADVLDIIFENRNKSYGAYYLRKHYQQYILRSIGISSVIVTILIFLITRDSKHNLIGGIIIDPTRLVDLSHDPRPLAPEPPKIHKQTASAVATFPYIIPRIVQDLAPTDPPMPDINDIGDKQISNVNSTGTPGDITQPPNNSPGQGIITNTESNNDDSPLNEDVVDEQAEYPGGIKALRSFLQRNLQDPREGDQQSEILKVKIRFVVEGDGSLGRFEILSSGGEIVEVLRVLHKMPKWKPAKKNGKLVAMYFVQPVTFTPAGE